MTAKSVGATANATHNGNRFNNNNWYQYTVDLSDYFGQTGYVAIRHFNCTDIFILNVDDIRIATPFDGVDLCEFTSEAFHVSVVDNKDVCNMANLEGFTVNEELQVDLYPNPTNGDAKIVSDHAVIQRVTVYNLMGQAILDEEVNNTETMLHLNGVPKGVYMLKVSSEEGYAMKKVVIE
jgi:hypothetical protein